MGGLARFGVGSALLALLGVGCRFSPAVARADATGATDAADAAEAADASPDAPVRHGSIVASMLSPNRGIIVVPYDTTSGFGSPCPLQPTSYGYRALYLHPALPYLYGAEAAFEGFALSCSDIAETTLARIGAARPLQNIVMEPSGQTGFFTVDGPGSLGVYQFTAGADGTPTLMGSVNGPSLAGALALSAGDGQLFTAGAGIAEEYGLTGSDLELPSTGTTAATCMQPAGLVISGSYMLAFCTDVADLKRYTRSPFAYDMTVGSPGTVSSLVSLPGDAAIIGRNSPPGLAFVDLNGGTPSWVDGPTLPAPALAMAGSADGKYLVTARQVDATTSELALWTIDGQAIQPVGTMSLDGTVAALAITRPQ